MKWASPEILISAPGDGRSLAFAGTRALHGGSGTSTGPVRTQFRISGLSPRSPNQRTNPSARQEFHRRLAAARAGEAADPFSRRCGVIFRRIGVVDLVPQAFSSGFPGAYRNLPARERDGSPRLLQKCAAPSCELVVPWANEDTPTHKNEPDAGEAMLGRSRPKGQHPRLFKKRQHSIREARRHDSSPNRSAVSRLRDHQDRGIMAKFLFVGKPSACR